MDTTLTAKEGLRGHNVLFLPLMYCVICSRTWLVADVVMSLYSITQCVVEGVSNFIVQHIIYRDCGNRKFTQSICDVPLGFSQVARPRRIRSWIPGTRTASPNKTEIQFTNQHYKDSLKLTGMHRKTGTHHWKCRSHMHKTSKDIQAHLKPHHAHTANHHTYSTSRTQQIQEYKQTQL